MQSGRKDPETGSLAEFGNLGMGQFRRIKFGSRMIENQGRLASDEYMARCLRCGRLFRFTADGEEATRLATTLYRPKKIIECLYCRVEVQLEREETHG